MFSNSNINQTSKLNQLLFDDNNRMRLRETLHLFLLYFNNPNNYYDKRYIYHCFTVITESTIKIYVTSITVLR